MYLNQKKEKNLNGNANASLHKV